MYNLFIVRSPLQIMNAYEAHQHFDTTKNILVIIHNSGSKNIEQIKKMVDIFNLNNIWDKIIEIEDNKKSKFFKYVKLIKRLQQNRYETIFIGDFGTIYRSLLANLEYKQSYLIDDGTSTIIAQKEINDYFHKRKLKLKLKELRFLFLGLRVKIRKSIDFFTIFDLKPINDETIIQHNFTNVKKKFLSHKHKDKNIYLLGQNLTQANIVSKEKYIFYIKQIIAKYKDQKIIYIPHRTEILHKELQDLANNNFILKNSTMPIEIFFLKNQIYPRHIISFHSTALYTLNIIFNESKIESFLINLNDIDEKVDIVKLCQEFLQTTLVLQNPLEKYTV